MWRSDGNFLELVFITLLLLSLVGLNLGVEVLSHTVCNFSKTAKLFPPVVTLCDSSVLFYRNFLSINRLSIKKAFVAWAWWPIPLIPALCRQSQVYLWEFKAFLMYTVTSETASAE